MTSITHCISRASRYCYQVQQHGLHTDSYQNEVIVRSLINTLQDCLRSLDEASAKLSYYTWQDQENSLLYHLELTMAMLKGEIFTLTADMMPDTLRVIELVSKSGIHPSEGVLR